MANLVLDYIGGISIILAFVLWTWWTLRLQEILIQGDFSRLPQRVRRMYGQDDLQISSSGKLGCRAKYWRLMPTAIFVMPTVYYLLDDTRPLPFAIRLLLTGGAFLVFGLGVYYLDHKLAQ
jgi:hypothetical protein